jgi:hypothetical protein
MSTSFSRGTVNTALGNSNSVKVLTSFASDFDCRASDPEGLGRDARSLVVIGGACAITDAAGNQSTLPNMGTPWQWVGFDVKLVRSSGTGATSVVVIW